MLTHPALAKGEDNPLKRLGAARPLTRASPYSATLAGEHEGF
jgi:hypothetical protein